MRTEKLLSDIISAIAVGDISTPYKIEEVSFYRMGDTIDIYYGNDQVAEIFMNEGGAVGELEGHELSSSAKTLINKLKGIFRIKENDSVNVIPITNLRRSISKYTARYSYDSVLASLYKYYDSSEIDDINTLYSDWLDSENNPVMDLVIDENNWSDELKTDIQKYIKG